MCSSLPKLMFLFCLATESVIPSALNGRNIGFKTKGSLKFNSQFYLLSIG